MSAKTCTTCDVQKSAWEFQKHRAQCRSCRSAYEKAYHTSNKARIRSRVRAHYATHKGLWRAQRIKQEYGLSIAQWDALWDAQSGMCKLCDRPLLKFGYTTHTDHCHASGNVRALLCRGCNIRIGYLENRGVEGLRRDLRYLGLTV